MEKFKIVSLLQGLGLSENEAHVYLSALPLGPTTVQRIAHASGLKRTTIYGVIKTLSQKGLLNVEHQGLKQLFTVEPPSTLGGMLELRQKELEKYQDELTELYNTRGQEHTFKVYEGLESVKNLYSELVNSLGPKDDYWAVGDHETWIGIDPDFFKRLNDQFIKRRIKVKLLARDAEVTRQYKKKYTMYDIKLFSSKKPITSDVIITPDQVIIHKHLAPTTIISIKNESVLQTHREMFEIMWNAVPE